MAVRVIAGRAHGRRLRVPDGGKTRPTSGLVRGALFNMLEHRGWLAEARVLDLYAGSGALGIEALSRGAQSAVFVDAAPPAVRALRENLHASGFADRARVLPTSVTSALRVLAREGVGVDGVLADPPYGTGAVQQVVDGVARAGVLAADGWIAIEHRQDEAPVPPPGFVVEVSRRHGRTAITLLQRTPAEEGAP